MKTLVNKNNPQIRITAPEIERRKAMFYQDEHYCLIIKGLPWLDADDWTLVEEESKHTEVWLEGRTIFEQDANTFVNTEGEPEAKLTGWVARDENGEIYVYGDYPEKDSEIWVGSNSMLLYRKSFPDLKWEDEPMEVEVTIRKNNTL